ncbi:hypothetical protein NQ315_003628, partial [Exocentrus adspersus]
IGTHIIPAKINKMKVKNCTQVFSHTEGVILHHVAEWDTGDRYNLPTESKYTADLILFLDKLFDSLNCDVLRRSGVLEASL